MGLTCASSLTMSPRERLRRPVRISRVVPNAMITQSGGKPVPASFMPSDALAADTVAKKGAAARLRVDDAYEAMQHSGDGGRGGACSRRLEDGTAQSTIASMYSM